MKSPLEPFPRPRRLPAPFTCTGAAAAPRRALRALTLALALAALGCPPRPSPGDPSQSERSGAAASSSAAPPSLKVATWNLEWLHGTPGAGTLKRASADYERLARYAARLDADVIAVQEVNGEEALRRLFADAEYDYHVTSQPGAQRTGFAYRARLAVTPHPDVTALAAGGLRSAADLSIDVGGRSLRLLSVHLKSGCFDAPLATPSNACTKLAAQLPVLERWIDERAAAGEPFLVLGDFNRRLRTGEPFFAELDDGSPPNADLTLVTEARPSRCWGGQYAELIDHLLLSRDAAPWLVPGSFAQYDYDLADAPFKATLSDHCPLSIVLRPSGPAAPARREQSDAAGPPAPPADGSAPPEPLIKGNINAAGKKLYHLPSCPSYAETRIDEARGERHFATEKEALAAGWKRAGNCP